MAWLEAINAPDIEAFIAGKDFIATQEMTEEVNQEVTYQGGFGVDGPILRQVRYADEGSFTFSAVLVKNPVAGKRNSETELKSLRDFEIHVRRGNKSVRYNGCNWTSISIRSTLDQVMIDCTISIPGYNPPSVAVVA